MYSQRTKHTNNARVLRHMRTSTHTNKLTADNAFLDSHPNCAGMPEEDKKTERKKQECCCKDIISIVRHAGKVVATQNSNDSLSI